MLKYVLGLALVAVVCADVSHLLRKDAGAQILRQESDIQPDGSYTWSYQTDNGIAAQEQANIRIIGKDQVEKSAQGEYSYTSDDGQNIQLSYIADENGYQPQGAHLPVSPPIPVAIQRALDWIASHPQQKQAVDIRGNF